MATNISGDDWISKYKSGAAIANHVCDELRKRCFSEIQVKDLAAFGALELKIETERSKTNFETGCAFPVCIAVNNCIQHSSPGGNSKKRIANADIVKLELGVHVDGLASFVGHTVVVGDVTDIPSRHADTILAAHYGLEAVLRTIKVGNTIETARKVLKSVCNAFLCEPIDNIVIKKLKQFGVAAHGIESPFQIDDVYAIQILVSSVEGKIQHMPKSSVYQRINVDKTTGSLGLHSRNLVEYVDSHFGSFPFSINEIPDGKLKKAISVCVVHNFLKPFPLRYTSQGSVVAQFMTTVVVTADGVLLLTGLKFDPTLLLLQTTNRITDDKLTNLLAENILKTRPERKTLHHFSQMCDERIEGLLTTIYESFAAWMGRHLQKFYSLPTPSFREPDPVQLEMGEVCLFFHPTTLQSLSSLAAPSPMTNSVLGKMVLAAHWAIVVEFYDRKRITFEGERKLNEHCEEYLLTCSPSITPEIDSKYLFSLGTKNISVEKLFEIAYHVPSHNKKYDVVSNNCHKFVREFLEGIDVDLLLKLEEVIAAS